jgi:hypothetical protein
VSAKVSKSLFFVFPFLKFFVYVCISYSLGALLKCFVYVFINYSLGVLLKFFVYVSSSCYSVALSIFFSMFLLVLAKNRTYI